MRPIWKGHLRISLVTIPVRMYSACRPRSEARVTFNELHRECTTRLEHRRWCPTCQRFVEYGEVAKGHEVAPGQYVIVEGDELRQLKPSTGKSIDLVQFAVDAAIDPMYVERPYYLAPDGAHAGAAFAVLREGMGGHVGIGIAVMFGREHLVAIRARERGLAMFLLRRHDELRPETDISEYKALPSTLAAQETTLARNIVKSFVKPLNLADYRDKYEQTLRDLVKTRAAQAVQAKGEITAVRPAAPTSLLDALRASLSRVEAGRKRPAKATLTKKSIGRHRSAKASRP